MGNHHVDHRSRGSFWWVPVFVVLPVLYVVCHGPTIWLVTTLDPDRNTVLVDVYSTVYYPIEWIYVSLGEPAWFAEYGAWWHNK
jgi:hypothetical protein